MSDKKERKTKYLTTPIYYVNARPHVGHAYTTLALDVLTRYLKQRGGDVFFLTGTDEHGAKIFQAAEKNNQEPQTFCNQIADLFKQAWGNLGIEYSHFIRTTDPEHEKKVAEFMLILKERGFLYEGEYSGLYCVGCEKFITGKELVNGLCPDHKTAPQSVAEKNWFFKLKEFLPQIEQLIKEDKLKVRPENAKLEALGVFKQGLEDISVSRQNVPWGIKLPWDEKQTVYVWVDALLNYWTAVQNPQRKKYWPADIHLVGRDILKFHCIYWPALLLAAGVELPAEVFVHGYFTINGQKMSKTIGNVIDPNELVRQYGSDAARYLLLSAFPFGNDGDISVERMAEKYNSDLASGLGNLAARVLTLANKLGVKKAAAPKEGAEPLYSLKNRYHGALAELNFHEALIAIWELISYCDKVVDTEKPWENKPNSPQVVAELLAYLAEIASLIEPFMPQTTLKIREQLASGQVVPLFPRLV